MEVLITNISTKFASFLNDPVVVHNVLVKCERLPPTCGARRDALVICTLFP